jgi:hypothetical protein
MMQIAVVAGERRCDAFFVFTAVRGKSAIAANSGAIAL